MQDDVSRFGFRYVWATGAISPAALILGLQLTIPIGLVVEACLLGNSITRMQLFGGAITMAAIAILAIAQVLSFT